MLISRHIVLSLFVTTLLFSCSHQAKKSVADPSMDNSGVNLDVHKYTLKNGLRVVLMKNDRLPIFSYYTFVDAGGRYERKGITGATHFLEHLMFKGAKKYGPGKFDSIIESNGGSTNAYTTFDKTVYYEHLPSDALEKIIDLEADRMANLLLEPEAFEKERSVVLEERKMRYENSPRGSLYLNMMQTVFKGTPYGGSVIGENEDLLALTRDQVRDYFKRYYAPNNTVVVVVGDIDVDDTLDMIEDKYGDIPKSEGLEQEKAVMDDPKLFSHRAKYNQSVRIHGNNPTPMFTLAFKGEPLGTRKAYVMDILADVLGSGNSSYFTQKYVFSKKPRLTSVNVSNYNLIHNGVFFISGELLKGSSLNGLKSRLVKDTRRVCRDALSERSLRKTKNQYLVSFYNQLSSNAGIAHFLGQHESYHGDYANYKKELEIYNSIELPELQKVCNEIFKPGEHIFLSIWNKHPKKRR